MASPSGPNVRHSYVLVNGARAGWPVRADNRDFWVGSAVTNGSCRLSAPPSGATHGRGPTPARSTGTTAKVSSFGGLRAVVRDRPTLIRAIWPSIPRDRRAGSRAEVFLTAAVSTVILVRGYL